MAYTKIENMYDTKINIQMEFESAEYKPVGENYMLAVEKLEETVNKLREGGLID